MLSDVESGIIGTIIVKDLSRFGIKNNMAGMYIKTILLQKDVRFISMLKNVDTLKRTGLDIMLLHNFMNTMYFTQEVFANLSANYAEEKSQFNNQIAELLGFIYRYGEFLG